MQAVAAELGYSETVFVDWRDGGVPRVRIFTPLAELPFAGYPLLGTGWLMNVLGPQAIPVLECRAGEVPIRVDGDGVTIEAPTADRVAVPSRLDGPLAGWVEPLGVFSVTMGVDHLLVQVADPRGVANAVPAPAGHVLLWAWEADRVKARFFAPELGVPEDPATGSAAVALATVLRSEGRPSGTVAIHQGDEIGAPSRIDLRWEGPAVWIGGSVVHDETRELAV